MTTAVYGPPEAKRPPKAMMGGKVDPSIIEKIAEIAETKGISKNRALEETLQLGLGIHPAMNPAYLVHLAEHIAHLQGSQQTPSEVLQDALAISDSAI